MEKKIEVPLCQVCAHKKRPLQDKPCNGCRENPVWRVRGEEFRWKEEGKHGISG